MRVAVLDHGMGNLRSVAKALEVAGATVVVTADPADAGRCDGMCVPGQGIFGRCMTSLGERGLEDVVRRWIEDERPYLGICLGMQVLFDHSDEGDCKGLGVLPGRVTRLPSQVTVPHIGWNTVSPARRPSPPRVATAGPPGPDADGTYFYFDHSFAAHPDETGTVTGWCEHGEAFAARIDAGSISGVQFHPEKSGPDGIALLEEWISDR